MVSLDFSVTYFFPTEPWPWVDSAPSENEYQDNPGGEGGRCVRLTTLPPYCAVVKKSRSLNFLDLSGSAWPVTGVLFNGDESILWRALKRTAFF